MCEREEETSPLLSLSALLSFSHFASSSFTIPGWRHETVNLFTQLIRVSTALTITPLHAICVITSVDTHLRGVRSDNQASSIMNCTLKSDTYHAHASYKVSPSRDHLLLDKSSITFFLGEWDTFDVFFALSLSLSLSLPHSRSHWNIS